MGFSIPNAGTASFIQQAEPDAVDIDTLTLGFADSGVVSGCGVTYNSVLTVTVAAGTMKWAGTNAAVAGGNLTVGAADPGLARFDLIVVNSSGTHSVVAGTAAATPVFPAIPATSVPLASVFVPAAATTLSANNIIDKRVILTTSGATVTVADDTTTNATMYPTWVTAATGNLPIKVSSTKMTFNPSTGLYSVPAVTVTGQITVPAMAPGVATAGIKSGTYQLAQIFQAAVGAGGQSIGNNVFVGGAGNNTLTNGAGATTLASGNTGVGVTSLLSVTTGNDNTAVGIDALYTLTSGQFNTAVGSNALGFMTTGQYNTAVGFQSALQTIGGQFNTAVGGKALNLNTAGSYNTAVGYRAAELNTADSTVAIGQTALAANTSGANNTAVGAAALLTNITGARDTAVGTNALAASTASDNTALGYNAGAAITSGGTNTSVGASALVGNQTGAGNVAVGFSAGKYETGSNAFYVDNQDRTNTAGDKAKALLYGTFNATAASQTLTVNAAISTIGQITSSLATGTAPLSIASTTAVTNLTLSADTQLPTISTAGKVSNSATTATSANTASAIVARDGSGNFTAGTITASGVTVNGVLRTVGTEAVTLSNGANQNVTLNAGIVEWLIVGPTAGFSIGGITGGTDGRMLWISNAVAQVMTLNNGDGGSTAANRLYGNSGANKAFGVGIVSACLRYSSSTGGWLFL